MRISILTMFPDLLDGLLNNPVVKRAQKQGIVTLDVVDIKDFADGSFRHIDDSPYGGGLGMIMRMEPLVGALNSVKGPNSTTVLLSPKGRTFNQHVAQKLSKLDHLILVCGHFEGVDYRFESYVDQMLSLGDFILTGGEPAATVVTDAIVRLLDGTFKEGVVEDESFSFGLLEHPQYTHPEVFEGKEVPKILLSGNTAEIEKFNHKEAVEQTIIYRKDIAKAYMDECSQKAFEELDDWLLKHNKETLCPSGTVECFFASEFAYAKPQGIEIYDETPKRSKLKKLVAKRGELECGSCLVWQKEDCACIMNFMAYDDEAAQGLVGYAAKLEPFICCRVGNEGMDPFSFN